jgi:hypothetical protein
MQAHNIAERDSAFLEIMAGPNPLTGDEIRMLIEKYPEKYGRYRNWAFAPAGTGQACGNANDCHLYKGHTGPHRSRFGREW